MEKENKLSSLPSIGELFKQSFIAFKESIFKLILVSVSFLAGIFLAAAFAGILLLVLFGGYFIGKTPVIPPTPLLMIGVVIVFLCLITFFVIALAAGIAPVLIVGRYKENIGFWEAVKKSFRYIIPLYFTNLLIFLLCLGGFFLFIFPAVVFSFLFMFAVYEVILNDKRFFGAIRRSVLLVSRRFGPIFARVIIFIAAYVFLVGIIPSLLRGSGSSGNIFVSIFVLLINFFAGYFSVCYYITLYKQARVGLEKEEGGSYWWIWVIAILGWIMFFALVFIVSSLIVNLIQEAGPSFLQNLENVPVSSVGSNTLQQMEGT